MKLVRKSPAGKMGSAERTGRSPPLPPPIRQQEDLDAALALLATRDPKLVARLVAACGAPPLRLRTPDYAGLAWIVVSQQVSVASADAIFGRLLGRFPDLDAAAIHRAGDDDLRGCGLSTPKVRTLRAIADAVTGHGLDIGGLGALPADEAHAALVAIKGIGPWTADIFLLSCLGHPDAWPAGDLALQEAARAALGLKQRPNTAKMQAIGERWRPVRAVAARLLWAWYRVRKQAERTSPSLGA